MRVEGSSLIMLKAFGVQEIRYTTSHGIELYILKGNNAYTK